MHGHLNGSSYSSQELEQAPLASPLLGPVPSVRALREWTLVLRSSEIAFAVEEGAGGFYIRVSGADHSRALKSIALYEQENRDWPPKETPERLPFTRSLVAPLIFLALVFFFGITGLVRNQSPFFAHGIAVSERVLHGQPWRAVTALTLHADSSHVLGNAISGTLFLSAVNRRLGNGKGPAVVLAAGTVGNLLNAVWYRANHASLGASTAVFGAVGVLVATQLMLNYESRTSSKLRRLAPLVAGLSILGFVGSAPHTDLMAHLFGLLGGILVGLPIAYLSRSGPSGRGVQWAFGLASLGVVGASWVCAFSPLG